MNKIIKNTLILAAITVVSGLVLGAAYEVTKDPIAQTQAKQKQEACQAVYPEADSFEAMDVDQKAAKEAKYAAGAQKDDDSFAKKVYRRKGESRLVAEKRAERKDDGIKRTGRVIHVTSKRSSTPTVTEEY